MSNDKNAAYPAATGEYDGLIERLRARAAMVGPGKNFGYYTDSSAKTDIEAADAIATLQAERDEASAKKTAQFLAMDAKYEAAQARIAALEEALTEIAEFQATEPWRITAKWMADRARTALAKEEK